MIQFIPYGIFGCQQEMFGFRYIKPKKKIKLDTPP